MSKHHDLTIRLHVCSDDEMPSEDAADKIWHLMHHGSIREAFEAAGFTYDAPDSVTGNE